VSARRENEQFLDFGQVQNLLVCLHVHEHAAAERYFADSGCGDAVLHPTNQKSLDEKLDAAGDMVKPFATKHVGKEFRTVLEGRASSSAGPHHRIVAIEGEERLEFLADSLRFAGSLRVGRQAHKLVLVFHRHHAGEVCDLSVERSYGMALIDCGYAPNF